MKIDLNTSDAKKQNTDLKTITNQKNKDAERLHRTEITKTYVPTSTPSERNKYSEKEKN